MSSELVDVFRGLMEALGVEPIGVFVDLLLRGLVEVRYDPEAGCPAFTSSRAGGLTCGQLAEQLRVRGNSLLDEALRRLEGRGLVRAGASGKELTEDGWAVAEELMESAIPLEEYEPPRLSEAEKAFRRLVRADASSEPVDLSELAYILSKLFFRGVLAVRYDPEVRRLMYRVSPQGWRIALELREELIAEWEEIALKVLAFQEEGYEIDFEGDEFGTRIIARRPE